ncbi:MAG: SAM-dependent methyltransferase [Rhodocyclaceae bacterium]
MCSLPEPDSIAAAHSDRLRAHICADIRSRGGWIPFSRYMEQALYAPGLGYYAAGAEKFGAAGDFITAPEISPLFAQSLVTQIAPLMRQSAPAILEAGPGSGKLAADLLLELERSGALPDQYGLLELSGDLHGRQRATLETRVPHLLGRVCWLDRLPERFSGVIIANELLDAMPVDLVAWQDDRILERGVAINSQGEFEWEDRPAPEALLRAGVDVPVEPPYVSEIGRAAQAWVAAWGSVLERGAMLLIDYGFPSREYYHPQRASGTLMCHIRHHAHADPFFRPGLCDITSHVDFSAMANAGCDAGLDFLGYTSQGQFLMNCGITDLLSRVPSNDIARYAPLASSVQKLLSPAEMGELFKVLALGREVREPLIGFSRGDRGHTL